MTDEQTEPTAQQRLADAGQQLAELNKLLPQGMPPVQPAPWFDLAATIDALVMLLIDKGIVTTDEMIDRKTERLAEILEQTLAQGRETRRQAMGLVIAQPGQQPH